MTLGRQSYPLECAHAAEDFARAVRKYGAGARAWESFQVLKDFIEATYWPPFPPCPHEKRIHFAMLGSEGFDSGDVCEACLKRLPSQTGDL